MWHHFCKTQKGWLLVGKDEPCNWCDCAEQPVTASGFVRRPWRLAVSVCLVSPTTLAPWGRTHACTTQLVSNLSRGCGNEKSTQAPSRTV